ncbi:hypothetical protein [Streptomyces tropicalis]|uniref:Uncharacterized protein n=1 Tax=Streptomyces tropicalis TaxID=3034234 RepID=A0ABT6A1V5_9ACTN|nr:hypothetical protein [Streptomyces tropicalis]MDF3298628.1 hypothetical protein [Streptomyces tropicalis]
MTAIRVLLVDDDPLVRAGPGVLPGGADDAEIAEAVRQVAAGDPVLPPAAARRLMRHAAGTAAGGRRDRARLNALDDRERDLAVHGGPGPADAESAAGLFTGVATVETRVSRVLAELGLSDRVQIALPAHDAGPTEEDTP